MLYQLSYLTVRPASPTASSSDLGRINLFKEIIGVKTDRLLNDLRERPDIRARAADRPLLDSPGLGP